MTEESLPTFTVGDTVRLSLKLRDEGGVRQCYAIFYRMENPEDPESTDPDVDFELKGDGGGLTDGTIELAVELTNTPPGVYWCDWIQVFDTARNKREIENPGIKALVVENPTADYEPPEVLEILPLTK